MADGADFKSNPQWKQLTYDRQINTLMASSDVTRFNDIVGILVTNKSDYLETMTEDEWLDRTYNFKYQGLILNNSTTFEDAEPKFSRTFLTQQDSSWFTDIRLNASTRYCSYFYRANWLTWLSSNSDTHADGSSKGPDKTTLENSSWLDSDTKALQDKLLSLTYTKYSYLLKMLSIYKNHYDNDTRYDAMDAENKYVLANLTTTEQTNLIAYVRETFVADVQTYDKPVLAELETACEMLEFDMSQ